MLLLGFVHCLGFLADRGKHFVKLPGPGHARSRCGSHRHYLDLVLVEGQLQQCIVADAQASAELDSLYRRAQEMSKGSEATVTHWGQAPYLIVLPTVRR